MSRRRRTIAARLVEAQQTAAMLTTMAGHSARAQQATDPQNAAGHVYLVGLNTTPLLFTLAELLIAWLLLRQAEIALAALGTGADPFYRGKVAAARWFTTQVLPQFSGRREILQRTGLGIMTLDDAAF